MLRVQDNGGKTFDRYTVTINGDVYTMSHNADQPNGFNQYCGPADELLECMDKEIGRRDWPKGLINGILDRLQESYY